MTDELPRDLDARYFEDYPPGLAVQVGPIGVVEANIISLGPDRGMVQTFNEFVNQRGEAVMTVRAMTLMRCRAATGRD